jgi:phenylalanyl-tRNA synthetase beta chain
VLLGEYRELKGMIEAALPALHYASPVFRKGKIFVDDHWIGELRQLLVESHPVQVCEISLTDLISIPTRILTYQPINPYPFVERDASLLLSETMIFEQIDETIRNLNIPELRSYLLTDRYQGANTPPGVVSLTFRFTFQASNRTLTSEEVDRLYARIVDEFAKDFGAELRK